MFSTMRSLLTAASIDLLFRSRRQLLLIDGLIDLDEISIILISINTFPFWEVLKFGKGTAAGRFFRPLEVGFFGVCLFLGFPWCKVPDVDSGWFALTLPDALNERILLQLGQQPDGLVVAAGQRFLDFVNGVKDEYTVILVQPAILPGQSHTVKHEAVEQFGLGGQATIPLVFHQVAGNTEKAELFGLAAVEVVEIR